MAKARNSGIGRKVLILAAALLVISVVPPHTYGTPSCVLAAAMTAAPTPSPSPAEYAGLRQLDHNGRRPVQPGGLHPKGVHLRGRCRDEAEPGSVGFVSGRYRALGDRQSETCFHSTSPGRAWNTGTFFNAAFTWV